MLLVIETPHRGDTRTWMAHDVLSFVVALLEAHPRADLDPNISFRQAAEWLAADLRALEIHEVPDSRVNPSRPEYPRGLDSHSAIYAGDADELRAIEHAATEWPTFEAAQLAEDARERLKNYFI